MNEENFKMEMSCYDTKVTIETTSDITISDAVRNVVTCLLGMTFSKEQIIKAFKEYLEEEE